MALARGWGSLFVVIEEKKRDHVNEKRGFFLPTYEQKINITDYWCRSEEYFWVLVQMDDTKWSSKRLYQSNLKLLPDPSRYFPMFDPQTRKKALEQGKHWLCARKEINLVTSIYWFPQSRSILPAATLYSLIFTATSSGVFASTMIPCASPLMNPASTALFTHASRPS